MIGCCVWSSLAPGWSARVNVLGIARCSTVASHLHSYSSVSILCALFTSNASTGTATTCLAGDCTVRCNRKLDMKSMRNFVLLMGIMPLAAQATSARSGGGGRGGGGGGGGGNSCPDVAACLESSENWNFKKLGDGTPQQHECSQVRTLYGWTFSCAPQDCRLSTLCCCSPDTGGRMQGMQESKF